MLLHIHHTRTRALDCANHRAGSQLKILQTPRNSLTFSNSPNWSYWVKWGHLDSKLVWPKYWNTSLRDFLLFVKCQGLTLGETLLCGPSTFRSQSPRRCGAGSAAGSVTSGSS